jgi:ankyrin repeat protein
LLGIELSKAALTRHSTSGGDKDEKKKRRCRAMASSDARLLALCKVKGNPPSFAKVQSLIADGDDFNAEDDKETTVLHWAVSNGYIDAVKALISAEGIDIDARNFAQCTAFMFACLFNHIEIAKELLEAHKKTSTFDINDASTGGITAILFACMTGNIEFIKFVLSIPHINTRLKTSEGHMLLDCVRGYANKDEIRAVIHGE